jgi:hypothetical protein
MSDTFDVLTGELAQQKLENFDRSTAVFVLRQLGASATQARRLVEEYGPSFGAEFVSSNFLPGVDFWTSRFFDFNMRDLLRAPTKSPVLAAFWERITSFEIDRRVMVFKAYDYGRLVATDIIPTRPYICCPGNCPCYITLFDGFFASTFGDVCKDLT